MRNRNWLRHHRTLTAWMITMAGFVLLPAPAAADKPVTDAGVTEAVEDEFLFDRAVPFNKIDVRVTDGIVTLSGTVHNILAKERAARLAETVKGVRAVVNDVTVERPEKRTATAVKRDVSAALLGDPATDAFEVDVKADAQGEVTLSGSVDSWQERSLAEKIAKGVRGVTAVTNKIDVKYRQTRSDAEIKAEIAEALRWNVLVDDALIDVTVNDGTVRLSGTVGSAAEKREARMTAYVAGVRSVDDAGVKVEKWARDKDLRKDKYVVKADEEIREAVHDALLYDPRVMSFKITPKVDNGVVTLRGTVDNLKARRAAEQDARNTVGVISVKNRIKIRPDLAITDEMIEEDVEAAMARDPYVDGFDVDVEVIDGVAYLSGSVDSYFEKGQADDVAARVNGVVDVRNRLGVYYENGPVVYDPYVDLWDPYEYDWYAHEPMYTLESDQQIKQEIEDELFWSPFVDADAVTVRVEDGVATLTGRVDSWSERRAATENAFEGGAAWVNNRIVVQ